MDNFSLLSRNFVLVCLASFLYFGSFYMLLPTLPQFVDSIGGVTSQIGIVMGLFTLASVIIRPRFGKLADKYGRKKLMMSGAGCFALLFVAYAQIQSIVPLYVLRIIHGIAHGSYLAAVYVYVADLAPAQRRGEVMGVYGVANVLSMALFPAVGSFIISSSHDFSRLFLYATAVAGVAFFAICFVDESRQEATMTQQVNIWEVGRKPAVLVASLTFFTASTVYGTVITFLPVYAPKVGMSNVGLFFSSYALFTLLSRVIAGKLSDRYGRRIVVLPFLALLAGATFLLPLLENALMLVVIGCCFGLGFGAFMPALNAFVIDRTLPHERASALAFFTAFMDVGITTGAVVLGVVGQVWGFGTMYTIGGIIICLGIILFACGSRQGSVSKSSKVE